MKISIIIPSFNQVEFIQETLDSIHAQNVDKELIVVDGGSTDGTLDVLVKNRDKIDVLISESDSGQADALRKGFTLASGDIFCWLNSDDKFSPGALALVENTFIDQGADIVYGDMTLIDAVSSKIGFRIATPWLPYILRSSVYHGGFGFYQPSTFWRRSIYEQAGGINPEFQFCMDNDLFARFIKNGAKIYHLQNYLAEFRVHPASKTSNLQDLANKERSIVKKTYGAADPWIVGFFVKNAARALRLLYLGSHRRGWRYIVGKFDSTNKYIP